MPGLAELDDLWPVRANCLGEPQRVVFDISGREQGRLIDVSTQLNVAREWVAKAATKKILGENDRLLIIGAGLAGLAAAREAHRRGVDVEIVDASGKSRTAGSLVGSLRWIHPTMYEWPAPNWRAGFHLSGDAVFDTDERISYPPGEARTVELKIKRLLLNDDLEQRISQGAVHFPSQITTEFAIIEEPTSSGSFVMALRLRGPNGPAFLAPHSVARLRGDFTRVLLCTGPVERPAALHGSDGWHGGHRYWFAEDPLIQSMVNPIDYVDVNPRRRSWGLLAFGAGDGGRQDLLHLAVNVDVCVMVQRLLDANPALMEEIRLAAEQAYMISGQGDISKRRHDGGKVIRGLAAKYRPSLHSTLERIGVHVDMDVVRRLHVFERRQEEEVLCYPLNRLLTWALLEDVLAKRYHQTNDPGADPVTGVPHPTGFFGHSCGLKDYRRAISFACNGLPHTMPILGQTTPIVGEYLLIRAGIMSSPFRRAVSATPDWPADP